MIVLTGATGLLGTSLLEDISEDITVLALSRDISKIKKISNTIIPYEIDINKETEIIKLSQFIKDKNYKLSGLINNAAARPDINVYKMKEKYQEWASVFSTNVISCSMLIEKLQDEFQENSSIVNISSIYSNSGTQLDIYEKEEKEQMFYINLIYGASKSALNSVSMHWAKYFNEKNKRIRVNSVILGGIQNGQTKSFEDKYSKYTLGDSFIPVSECVGIIKFLLSKASNTINGEQINANKGWKK